MSVLLVKKAMFYLTTSQNAQKDRFKIVYIIQIKIRVKNVKTIITQTMANAHLIKEINLNSINKIKANNKKKLLLSIMMEKVFFTIFL